MLRSIEESESIQAEIRLKLTPRTKASIVNDCAVHNLAEPIEGMGGRVVRSHGQYRFWLSDYCQMCVKKLGKGLRPARGRTKRSQDFLCQQTQFGFSAEVRQAKNVILGYRLDRAEVEAQVYLICPDGPVNEWEIGLDELVPASAARSEKVLIDPQTLELQRRPAPTINPIGTETADGKEDEKHPERD